MNAGKKIPRWKTTLRDPRIGSKAGLIKLPIARSPTTASNLAGNRGFGSEEEMALTPRGPSARREVDASTAQDQASTGRLSAGGLSGSWTESSAGSVGDGSAEELT